MRLVRWILPGRVRSALSVAVVLVLWAGSPANAVPVAPAEEPSEPAAAGYRFERQWDVTGSVTEIQAVTTAAGGGVWVASADRVMTKYSAKGKQLARWQTRKVVSGGLARDAAGNLHATFTSNYADRESGGVAVYTPSGRLLRTYFAPVGDGSFHDHNPLDVAIDEAGNSYTVDPVKNLISRFAPDGTYLGSTGSTGVGPGQFQGVGSIEVHKGSLFVADGGNHRIQQLTADGDFIRSFGQLGTAPGQLRRPNALAFGPGGNLFVLDGNSLIGANTRVQEFTPRGRFVGHFGRDRFSSVISDVAVDSRSRVYVGGRLANQVRGVATFVKVKAGRPRVVSDQLVAKRGATQVRIRCVGDTACAGKVRIKGAGRLVAHDGYRVRAGATSSTAVSLTAKGRRLMKQRSRVRVEVALIGRDGGRVVARMLMRRR